MFALRAWLMATAVLILPVAALADEAAMQAFVQQVVVANPSLQARRHMQRSLLARASAEGYWPDPELQVMLDRVPERHDGEMPMLRYQLSQMIMWPGKLDLMESAAHQKADAAAADVQTRKLELVREAQRAYLMLAQNRGYDEVNRSARQLLETVTRSAIARYGAGSGNHHEVVRAEVERSALEVEALSLEGERVSMLAMLNALRNLPSDARIDEPGPPDAVLPLPHDTSLAALVQLALSRRPELKRMRAMVREETTMADLARRQRYPDFMGGVWYNQMLGGADTAGIMVGATIPLFSVPRQNRTAQAADWAAQSARGELSAMQAMIRFEIGDALQRAQTGQRSFELVTKVAKPRAEQSFASSLAAYATGGSDLVLVLDAWRALQRLELARIDAVIAARLAVVDLEWALAGPLPRGDLK
jgi:outer membrane protein, heavy metal efflux system